MLVGSWRKDYISVLFLSPFATPDESRRIVPIAVYVDQSGYPHSNLVTLSSIYGSESVWASFEPQWKDLCVRHNLVAIHMSELLAKLGPEKTRMVAREAMQILTSFHGSHIEAHTCTLDRAAYETAKL